VNKYSKNIRLGDILLKKNEITKEQLSDALKSQVGSGKRLGEVLIQKGYITEFKIMTALSEQFGIEIVNLDNYVINMDATKFISEKLAKRTNSIPLKIWNDKILVAINDPLNIFDIEDIEMESGKKVEIVLATKSQIQNTWEEEVQKRQLKILIKKIL
jgi:type IV pilus assembly protein PilB